MCSAMLIMTLRTQNGWQNGWQTEMVGPIALQLQYSCVVEYSTKKLTHTHKTWIQGYKNFTKKSLFLFVFH